MVSSMGWLIMIKEDELNTFKKAKLTIIYLIPIALYLTMVILLKNIASENRAIQILGQVLEPSTSKGLIIQFQMIISVLMVLKDHKIGFVIAMILNTISLVFSVVFLILVDSSAPLPGMISYISVLLIIYFIKIYKIKSEHHISEIECQKKGLESSEEKLNQMAFYDLLTGLPNKVLFDNLLNRELSASERNESLLSVIFLDIDSFKYVNDTMGHSAGDCVLRKISKRLENSLRKNDVISRFSGDEFTILITDIKQIEDIHSIINKLKEEIKRPITVDNSEFFITSSIGVAIYPVDGEDAETLIKNAEMAMYMAKNQGKNQYVFCSEEIKKDVTQKIRLTNSLYRAIERDELLLHYQPQVNTITKEIVGFEALLRWNSKEHGMISPSIFIPLAEKTGLIKPIGFWVLKTVFEQCKICKEVLKKDFRISINMSIEQLKDSHIISKVSDIILESEINPKNIQIEVTESVACNEDDLILQRINELKALGFSISIDDFGTGHSSLSRLKLFPIDLIKIDMEFVQGISNESDKDKAIIRSIIQISKNLEIDVLAEGVETEEQYEFLKSEGCKEIQGYYFYKPMPADAVKELLINNNEK